MENKQPNQSKEVVELPGTSFDNTKSTGKTKSRGKSRKSGGHRNHGRKPETPKASNNDVSWYKQYPDLFMAATNVSTAKIVGTKWYSMDSSHATIDYSVNDACVTVIKLAPTLGGYLTKSSAVNRAGDNLYNIYRGKYTSTLPFESSDVMCMLGAFGSILALATHIRKLLNIINMFSPENTAVPRQILRSLGLDYDTERQFYAVNKFNYDILLNQARFLTIPKFMPYFEKCVYVFKDVFYQDTAGMRGDFIVTTPKNLYKFAEIENASGLVASGLIRQSMDNVDSIAELIDTLNVLLNALIDNESVKQISGWLNQNNGLTDTLSGFEILSTFVDSVKVSSELPYQLKNARMNKPFTDSLLTEQIKQDENGKLISTGFDYNILIAVGKYAPYDQKSILLNGHIMYTDHKPTNDDIMIDTRFAVGYAINPTSGTDGTKYSIQAYCDTWCIQSIEFTFKDYSITSESSLITYVFNESIKYLTSAAYPWSGAAPLVELIKIRPYSSWLPTIYLAEVDTQNLSVDNKLIPVGSRNYNYEISNSNLIRLHEVCLLSEFYQTSTKAIG